MFSLTDEFVRAQHEYTRERLSGHARPRRDGPSDHGTRRGLLSALFHRDPRHRVGTPAART
jgi:hypothetical protein